jgi:L-rhamnose-H+ transport protein
VINPNPLLGVFFHWLGGLSSASFYVPYRRIRCWSWEIFWITGGLCSWLIAPWLVASLQTRELLATLLSVGTKTLFWCWFWGAMWGLGGLTFGLTMRYLGLSLGMAIALGLTTVIGTLGPPIFRGILGELAASSSGRVTLIGVGVTLLGIVVVALAGRAKERELTDPSGTTPQGVPEFALKKGLLIAVFSGIMSGCFAWGLDAGQPIRAATLSAGTNPLWQGLPVLCVVLAGGLTTNLIWCGVLIRRNGTIGELIGHSRHSLDDPPPLLRNYLLAALG